MSASSCNLLTSLCVWLALAVSTQATEHEKPKPEGAAAPDAAPKALPPVTSVDDVFTTELSAAETARVEEISEEVRRLYEQNPHAALPADLKTPLYGQRGYNAWIQAMYADAWRVHGKHDPRWDADAAKLIDDYVLPERLVPAKELVARGRKLLADGCDDPLIRFVVGGSLDLAAGNSVYQAIEVLKPALDQLPPDYPPDVAYRVELRFIEAWDRAYPRKPKESSDVVERILGRIKRVVAGPLTNDDRRRQFQRLINAVHGPLNRYLTRFYPSLAASSTTDRWLLQVLLAQGRV